MPGPSRRLTWMSATALLGLGAPLGVLALDRGISTLPAYFAPLPLGVLPPGPYAALLLTAGLGLLVDLSGHVRGERVRRALWAYGIFMLGVVCVYSLEAILFGPIRPLAALAGYVALFGGALSAWWPEHA